MVWVACDSLRRLKHTGTVREYVKNFNSLMLVINDMAKEDCLYNFLSGLQGWAQLKLRRQGVKDLQFALIATDALVDFKTSMSVKMESKTSKKEKSKGKVKTEKSNTDRTKHNEVRSTLKGIRAIYARSSSNAGLPKERDAFCNREGRGIPEGVSGKPSSVERNPCQNTHDGK